MYCLIQFTSILQRIFASMFIRDIGLQFSFFVVSLARFDIRVMLASQNEFGNIPSVSIFWNSLRRIGINCSLNVWSEQQLLLKMWRKRKLLALLVRMELVKRLWKTVWRFLMTLKTELPYHPAITLVGIYPKATDVVKRRGTCIPIFIAAVNNSQTVERAQMSTD